MASKFGDQIKFYGTNDSVRNKLSGVPYKKIHRKLPFLLPKSKLWHATHQDSEFIPFGKAKKILTIHDLNYIHERFYDKVKCSRYLKKLQKKINRVDAVVFISKSSYNEVTKYLDLTGKRVEVIYNGVSLERGLKERRPWFVEENENFLFSLGTVVPKKNFHVLVELMRGLQDYKLVIAGTDFHSYAHSLKDQIREEGLEKRILIPGIISEEEKVWCYKNSAAFLFPSMLEGFGLPVVEAMSFGKPLFLSKIDALKEVGGDDAFYFEEYDTVSMVELFESKMKLFFSDDKIRTRLINRSKNFSWEMAAESYFKLYQELLLT